MEIESETEQLVIKFIQKFIGDKNVEIPPMTELQDDLNIYGDDAVEFLLDFSMLFKVDITSFNSSQYFKGEGFDIFTFLGFKKTQERKKIYVQDLIHSVEFGVLDELKLISQNTSNEQK